MLLMNVYFQCQRFTRRLSRRLDLEAALDSIDCLLGLGEGVRRVEACHPQRLADGVGFGVLAGARSGRHEEVVRAHTLEDLSLAS